VYGCLRNEGRKGQEVLRTVPICPLQSNTVYVAKSMCIALVCSIDGNGFYSSHADGKIYKYMFDDGSGTPPYHPQL
jgi:hypothetical protein